MSTDPTPAAPGRPARPLSPAEVRAVRFERAPFGRRGLDEFAVARHLDRVAREIATRDVALGRLLHENRTLKHALREWQREMIGYDGVDLVALAQQEIEEQIAQTEAFSREREEEAARLYDEIVAEAYERAEQQMATPASDVERERAHRQRTLIVAVLQSLEALATQVDATRHAFSFEVDQLEILDGPSPDGGAAGPPDAPGLPVPADPGAPADPADPVGRTEPAEDPAVS